MKISIPWSAIEQAAAQRGPAYLDEVRAVAQTEGTMCVLAVVDYNVICARYSGQSGLRGIPANSPDAIRAKDKSRADAETVARRREICGKCQANHGLRDLPGGIVVVRCAKCTHCEGGRSITARVQTCPIGQWPESDETGAMPV
jgi:hypothetical protein